MRAGITLRRLAVIVLTPAPGAQAMLDAVYGDVEVETIKSELRGNAVRALVVASSPLTYRPKRTADRYVVVPDAERRRCEQAIEVVADLVSIANRARRAISSPFPWVAFEATSDEAREWLDASIGIHELDRVVDIPSASSVVPLEPEIIDGLRDRSDGTVLVAEALAHTHPTGQFLDFFRLFERAFRLAAHKVEAPLHELLADRYGYTPPELEGWGKIRDAATHADVRSRFVVEADVRPHLARVRQAAYDVLFNKAHWRDPSTDRRELWTPNGWTRGPSSDVVMVQHSTGRLEAQLLDQFGAYPTDLEAGLTSLPDGWWSPEVQPRSPERPVQVIAEHER